MQPTDIPISNAFALVVGKALRDIGMNVDLQAMDWSSVTSRRAKKDPVDKGGWNISMTAASVALLSDPIINHYTEASGDRAQFGWPLDEEIEKLRMEYVRESDPKKQFELGEKVQKRVLDLGVTVPLGQFVQPMARRRGVSGNIQSPVTVFWNVEKG